MPLPKPRPNEERGKFISRCISFAVGDGMPQDQAVAACHTQWRAKQQMKLKFNVPIQVETAETGITGETDFMINGVAINAVTTDNQHTFLAEELREAATSLTNRPLLIDHDDTLRSVAGKVTHAEFDEVEQNIKFKARINNTEPGKLAKELIKIGDVNSVSVGAVLQDIEEGENDTLIPRGIKFKELSIVAVPADDDAQFATFKGDTINMAIQEAWKSHSNDLVVDNTIKLEEKYMKDKKISEAEETESEEPKEEKEEEVEVEPKEDETSEKLDALTKLVSEVIVSQKKTSEKIDENQKSTDEKIAKLEEADVDEEPEPAPEPEPEPEEEAKEEEVEEVEEEEEEEEEEAAEGSNYKIVAGHSGGKRSFTTDRNQSSLGSKPDLSKLK